MVASIQAVLSLGYERKQLLGQFVIPRSTIFAPFEGLDPLNLAAVFFAVRRHDFLAKSVCKATDSISKKLSEKLPSTIV